MIRGLYTAASGMITETTRTDVISNNLANVTTTGYKKDETVSSEFERVLIRRINDGQVAPQIGELGRGSKIDEIYTQHEQGSTQQTGNTFDLAIEGKGYFVIDTPQGTRYTRNGSFNLAENGQLVTNEGFPVLTGGRPVQINGNGNVTIGADGQIALDNEQIATLDFVEFDDDRVLKKEGNSMYVAPQGERSRQATGKISQGQLELSNVNVVSEMVKLINAYRAYETNAKALQSEDSMLEKAVNEVGRG